ncbi:MAG TPA: hypothetical protein PK022_08740 [Syntrophales bacterium]|nr:hypothetical protein [Syntrophales bacterium]
MNIQNIHIFQGLQNAVRPAGENNSVHLNRSLSVGTTINSGSLSGEPEIKPGYSTGIIAQINNLQKHVESDLNIVRDPPFFPIATYQRADLVKRVRVIEEAVQQLGLEKDVKTTLTAKKLKEQATDQEIATALDKLFAFRDRQKKSGPSLPAEIKPGSLLAVEI